MEKNLSSENEFSGGEKNSQKEKIPFGKLAGIIFCILAAVCTVVLMFVSGYFGGQMKTIDKFFTAAQRSDFNSYKACFSKSTAAKLTESDMEAARLIALVLDEPEEFRTDVSFAGRQKLGRGRYSVTFDITVYNDSESEKIENVTRVLVRDSGKWVFEVND